MKLNLTLVTSFLISLIQITAQELPICDLSNLKIRKNLNQLTDTEWTRYVNAVKKINEGSRLTTWDKFIKNHIDYFPIAHSMGDETKNLFLVWHRLYLYFVEKELQKVDPSVTIPYWDWTLNHKDIKNDIAFSDKFFGGQSTKGSTCVVNGRFKSFKVGIIERGQRGEFCLSRSSSIFDNSFTDPEELDSQYINSRTFQDFANIEFGPHGNIHVSIGEQFSGTASAGDPIFYSHHAFVDKVWFDFQNRNLDEAITYSQPLGNLIPPWNIPIRQVIDPFDRLCVAYREEHFSWTRPEVDSAATTLARSTKVDSYVVPKDIVDLEALKKYDETYIKNGLIDITNLRTPSNLTPIRKPIPLEFILNMKYNLTKFRELERRDAIFVDSLNKVRMVGK